MKQVELAVGKFGGQWHSQWVDIPEGKNPIQVSETEWISLLTQNSEDIAFVHLMYVEPDEEV